MSGRSIFELQNVSALTETTLIDENDVANAAIQIKTRHALFVVAGLQSFQERSTWTADQLKDWRDTSRMRRAKAREPYANDAGFWIRAILGYVQRTQLEGNCLAIRRRQRPRFGYDLTGFSSGGRRVGALRKVVVLPQHVGLGHDQRKNENQGRDEKHCSSRFHRLPLSAEWSFLTNEVATNYELLSANLALHLCRV